MPASERPPSNWQGWREGKKFAFVLMHDVESSAGLSNCRSLAQLEMELGFRSSFNLVPEGNYRVPAELRDELTARGFEIGIHDLRHDGHLFPHTAGSCSAISIGCMISTCNTMHPRPTRTHLSRSQTDVTLSFRSGCHAQMIIAIAQQSTRNCAARGYLELPYTLPQDSTLFLLLSEKTTEIWRRKLDWIAQHGGMAFINTHPDYMALAGARPKAWEYPIAFYNELLNYIRSRYPGEYWPALPRQVAAYLLGSTALTQNKAQH